MKNITITILSLTLFACAEAPAPVPMDDASVPAPEPLAAEIWEAVQLEHPTTCARPDVQRLTHDDFERLLGICGGGACNASCAVCSSAETYEGRIVITTSTGDAILVGEVLTQIAACEAQPFDTNAYLGALERLGL
jgi:hypothetical protein